MEKKGKKPGSINKETENNPGYGVSIDQSQSVQPGLVPQFSGKLTSERIWSAGVMVDNFSYLNYVYLMIRIRQEETLSGKSVIEKWAAKFGFKINIYHADNGKFSEHPFRLVIEDTNQKIIFCGVGSNHKNSIIKRKIQTLTLGAIALLLHAKIYWTD